MIGREALARLIATHKDEQGENLANWLADALNEDDDVRRDVALE
jgi:hypothetical protein